MEEMLVYAILLYEELVTENDFIKRLDELFLDNPENDDLLYLEWETDIRKATLFGWRGHVRRPYSICRLPHILFRAGLGGV